MRHTLVWVLLSGCGFTIPATTGSNDASPGDGPPLDTPVDAATVIPPDALLPPDAASCHGGYRMICLATPPTAPRVFATNTTIDTGSAICETTTLGTAAGLCVVSGTTISIENGATVRGVGPKPLVLLATTGAITISGTIDVASKRGGSAGAGHGTGACQAGTNPSGDSGGQGGSFGSTGGDGGDGRNGNGGNSGATTALGAGDLRGGCDGANGAGAGAGNGGAGGGAALVSSPTQIVLAGQINASGAGGRGANGNEDGGGGGGSGGVIVLDAPSIGIVGFVFANGGGGGEGSGGSNAGQPGTDPTFNAAGQGGAGGTGNGGDGGDGGRSSNGQNGVNGDGGGGAGGGGDGVIRTTSNAAVAGTITPAP